MPRWNDGVSGLILRPEYPTWSSDFDYLESGLDRRWVPRKVFLSNRWSGKRLEWSIVILKGAELWKLTRSWHVRLTRDSCATKEELYYAKPVPSPSLFMAESSMIEWRLRVVTIVLIQQKCDGVVPWQIFSGWSNRVSCKHLRWVLASYVFS